MLWMALSILCVSLLLLIWWPFLLRSPEHSWKVPAGISLGVVIIMAAGYSMIGTPSLLSEPESSAEDTFAVLDSDELRDLRVQKLHEALQGDLNNTELWSQLGYAYLYTNEFTDALSSFQVASQLAPERADLVSAQGIAHYYQAGQKLNNDASGFIQQALNMDPEETNALLLLASDHFHQGRYNEAIEQWQLVLDSGVKDIDRASIIEQINTARMFY